jgi:hypothetical protein
MKNTLQTCLVLAAAMVAGTVSADNFNNLFRVMSPRGDCQIRRLGQETFEPVIKGKAYQFGSLLKCGKDSEMVLSLSEKDAVAMTADSVVTAKLDRENGNRRIVSLMQGEIKARLDVLNTNASVIIDTPVGRCVSMVGNAKLKLTSTLGEDTLDITAGASCQMRLVGPQFVIPELKVGYSISISSLTDNSQTRIRDVAGDYRIFVNKGLEFNPMPSESEEADVLLPVAMSAQSTVKIWREKAPVGGRLIVSVLATGPDGKGRESYAFAVGRNNVVTRSNVFGDAVPATDTPATATETADGAGADIFAEPTDAAGFEEAATPAAEETTTAPAQQDNSLDDFLF